MTINSTQELIGLGVPPYLAIELAGPDRQTSARKYLISYEKNAQNITQFNSNIGTYEKQPFDGVGFNISVTHPLLGTQQFSNFNFGTSPIPWSGFQTALTSVQGTDFIKYQHNFVATSTQVQTGETLADWFDIPAINGVIHNFRMAARFARAGFLRGIIFDPEPSNSVSGFKLFCYPDRPLSSSYTLAQYQAQAQAIGARIMEVMQEEYPEITFFLLFAYEQYYQQAKNANTTPNDSTDNYGLFKSFLNGLFDTRKRATIVAGYELSYPYISDAAFAGGAQENGTPNTTVPVNYKDVSRGFGRYLDYPVTQTFDTSVDTNNQINAAQTQSSLVSALSRSDKYVWMYNNQVKFFNSNTVPTTYFNAMNNARISVGLDPSFSAGSVTGLLADVNALTMGLANNANITGLTDVLSNVFTEVTSSGHITFKTSGINSLPGLLFTNASSQYLICNALAASFTGEDMPLTIYVVGSATSGTPAASRAMFGLGRSATTNPVLCGFITSASKYSLQRQDDSGSSTTAAEGTGSADTSPHVIAFTTNGIVANIWKDALSIVSNVSQNKGTMTLGQFAIGANFANTPTFFWDGYIGRVLIYKNAHGTEQIKYISRGLGAGHAITVS